MANPKMEMKEELAEKKEIKQENTAANPEDQPKEVHYFQCYLCSMREAYDYFGMNPPYTNKYLLMEDAYVIEDPFLPPRTGQFIILGTVCVKCKKAVCKDPECSTYFDGTYCVRCAKEYLSTFPKQVQEKINKMVSK